MRNFLGAYEFSLSNVNRQVGHQYFRQWVPLKLPEDPSKIQGYLLLSTYVLKPGDETPSTTAVVEEKKILRDPEVEEGEGYVLNVLIYRAQDILTTHNAGKLDSFVSVRFNGNQIQTESKPNDISPIWNIKFEMPFSQPLTSDSIEIQLWNHSAFSPDRLIGQFTENYFRLGLTHKDWGPRWINLFSNQYAPDAVTFWGEVQDSLLSSQQIAQASEYVGKILVRMSVSARNPFSRKPPRLADMPCNPTADPKGEYYCLHWMLYASAEIPVMGGHVMCELVFGSTRLRSKWRLGREGVFEWNEQKTGKTYAPMDGGQVHDAIINVYHRVGRAIRKICFERIPFDQLVPDPQYYYINGVEVPEVKGINAARYRGAWRTLRHLTPDPSKPHVVAGFINMSLGIGSQLRAPPEMPKIKPGSGTEKYILRSFIYHAANLPAASPRGHSNPHLVLRFGMKNQEFPTRKSTLFPFWNMYSDMGVEVNPTCLHQYYLYIMVYHKSLSEYQLLGRCQVLAKDITRGGQLHRFRLEVPSTSDEKDNGGPVVWDSPTTNDPYLLASFHLFHPDDRPRLPRSWRNKCTEPAPNVIIQPSAKTAAVKLECLGVRELLESVSDEDNVVAEFSVPAIPLCTKRPSKDVDLEAVYQFPGNTDEVSPLDWNTRIMDEPAQFRCEFEGKFINGRSAQMMEMKILESVQFPAENPWGLPLRVRLASSAHSTDRVEIGHSFKPLLAYLNDDQFEALADECNFPSLPKWYQVSKDEDDDFYAFGAMDDDNDEEKKEETAKLDAVDVDIAGFDRTLVYSDVGMMQITADDAKNWGLDIDKEINVAKDDFEFGEEEVVENRRLADDDDDDDVDMDDESDGGEAAEEEEKRLRELLPCEAKACQGKTITCSDGSMQMFKLDKLSARKTTGVVKFFISAISIPEDADAQVDALIRFQDSESRLDDLMEKYESKWVARLYVYNAFNLTPRDRKFGSYQSANPFLVIRNGDGTQHEFNTRANARKNTISPGFHQVFELVTSLPEHSSLEISVWDCDELNFDDLIGSCKIDLEERMLLGNFMSSREPLLLQNPVSSNYQGKLFCKLHLLEQEQARRQKAEEIAYQPDEEYELRVVLWNTRSVRFGDPKKRDDDVDQRVVVISNFDGVYNQDAVKQTDVAWISASGNAEWNYRMVWPVTLPAKVPRLKLQLWDENITSENEAIGECIYNLKPFFDRAQQYKQSVTHSPSEWLSFTHPNHVEIESLGDLNLEMWLYTKSEARKNRVGEAQNEPNENPYLPKPHRNPPPWAVGTRALDFLGKYKMLAYLFSALSVILPVIFIALKANGTL